MGEVVRLTNLQQKILQAGTKREGSMYVDIQWGKNEKGDGPHG